jgi:hypothetical protein
MPAAAVMPARPAQASTPVTATTPVAPPVLAPPPVPIAMPVLPAAPITVEDVPQKVVVVPRLLAQKNRPRARGRARGLSPGFVALAVLIFGVLGVVIVTALGITGNLPPPLDSGWAFLFSRVGKELGQDYRKYNFRYRAPDSPWTADQDLKLAMKVEFAYRRSSPNRWLALVAKDYKDRSPRDSDLHDEIIPRLRAYFKDMEYGAPRNLEFAGKPAKVLEFQGQVNSVMMNGECVMLSNQGIGYWLLTWSPLVDKDQALEEWPALRERFSLMNERDGWSKDLRKMATVQGDKASYTLRFAEAIWEKQDPASADQAAEIYLLGSDPNEVKDASKTATAQVLLLPLQDDLKAATAATKDYILKMQKEGGYPETERPEVQKDKDGDLDRKTDVGNRVGQIVQLRVKNGETRQRYVLAAVLLLPDNVLAIVCECDWRRRDYWQQEFLTLLEKLQVKSAAK